MPEDARLVQHVILEVENRRLGRAWPRARGACGCYFAGVPTRDPDLHDPAKDGVLLASGDALKIEALSDDVVSLRVRDGSGAASRIYLTRAEALEYLAPSGVR